MDPENFRENVKADQLYRACPSAAFREGGSPVTMHIKITEVMRTPNPAMQYALYWQALILCSIVFVVIVSSTEGLFISVKFGLYYVISFVVIFK
jgi:hypothetical protein